MTRIKSLPLSLWQISYNQHVTIAFVPPRATEGAGSGTQRHRQRPTSSSSPYLGPSVSPRLDTPVSIPGCPDVQLMSRCAEACSIVLSALLDLLSIIRL